jgi:hypothetical protein
MAAETARSILSDVQFALRLLRRAPGFFATLLVGAPSKRLEARAWQKMSCVRVAWGSSNTFARDVRSLPHGSHAMPARALADGPPAAKRRAQLAPSNDHMSPKYTSAGLGLSNG